MIQLHILDSLHTKKFREIHVQSPDTGVLILLIVLISNGPLGTELKFCTCMGAKYREIDVRSCVHVIGQHKAKGLIGLQNSSGAEWEGSLLEYRRKAESVLTSPLKIQTQLLTVSATLAKQHCHHQS